MKNIIKSSLAILLALTFAACSAANTTEGKKLDPDTKSSSTVGSSSEKSLSEPPKEGMKTIKVGASPSPHAEILEKAKEILQEKNINLEIVEFTDYVLPNTALDSGDIDANFFQHKPYLEKFNAENGTDIVGVAAIHFEPLGLYSGKSTDINNIPQNAVISVPNDSTNEARALLLLQDLGIIKLKDNVGLEATTIDIVENPHNIEVFEIEAAQLLGTIADVDFAVINGNYAVDGNILNKVIAMENKDGEACKTYANLVAVKAGNEDNELVQELVAVLQSDEIRTFINDRYKNLFVPAF
ncbi:MAG: MetQ/NlpA family ABC transporter substrate-binding protein [Oscillospiraceae bacterium]